VVYNHQCDWEKNPINCYGMTVGYRGSGAVEAAKKGGIAALVRTVGAFSIASPHTGGMEYDDKVTKIPTAAIAIEDAEMLQRLFNRGIELEIEITMNAQRLPDGPSYNVVGEIRGSHYPEQVVIVSGHMDSWDVGQGAMDDGAGAIISWQVVSALKKLNIVPKRTIRFVGWSCEEFGGYGAEQYFEKHKGNITNMDLVMESDLGVFKPRGILFSGNKDATEIMAEIVKLLKPLGADKLAGGGEGTDIEPWIDHGVPGISLDNANEKYFWFHHSEGDMLTLLNSDDLDLGGATWAVTAFLVANLDDMLPR